jgi:sulfide:quinone oxidoreductase
MSPAQVVIAGGGVAGLEALLALRALAPDRAEVSLVSPQEEFVYRPLTVLEPFDAGKAQHLPLTEIAAEVGARFVPAPVRALLADRRRVVLAGGATVHYDALVLAPGARAQPAFDDAITFGLPGSGDALRALVASDAPRIAFVAPTLSGWLVPLYELALLAASRSDAELLLVTPESSPLAAFGAETSAMVAGLLADAGIEFVSETYEPVAGVPVVSLPLLRGQPLEGVPGDDHGFIPVDVHGRVPGLDGVYAAGDATNYPLKQGGLAAQQADAAAAHLAGRLGAPVAPAPFRPILQGMLLTGRDPLSLAGSSRKLAARHLAPYLEARAPAPAGEEARGSAA